MSAAPLTGYDNVDANPAAKGARDEEVYLYDSATASLRCVSCNPTGARPNGVLDTEEPAKGSACSSTGAWSGAEKETNTGSPATSRAGPRRACTTALFQSRYLSDEGRLFFNSPDDLVPAATNHKEDVYEYEPSGVGSCESPTGGCVSLISAGSSTRIGVPRSHAGRQQRLLPDRSAAAAAGHRHGLRHLRRAGMHHAFAVPDATRRHEERLAMKRKACRPAEPAQPIPAAPPATMTISGPGNVAPEAPPAKGGGSGEDKPQSRSRGPRSSPARSGCVASATRTQRRRALACERTAQKALRRKKHPAEKTKGRRSPKDRRSATEGGDDERASALEKVRGSRSSRCSQVLALRARSGRAPGTRAGTVVARRLRNGPSQPSPGQGRSAVPRAEQPRRRAGQRRQRTGNDHRQAPSRARSDGDQRARSSNHTQVECTRADSYLHVQRSSLSL